MQLALKRNASRAAGYAPPMQDDAAIADWFLTSDERGNAATELDRHRGDERAFTVANHVDLLVHGAPYFEELHHALSETQPGDIVHFADWRGDPDQQLVDGVEFAAVLVDLAKRGIEVRGLIWRSHPKTTGFHLEHHLELAKEATELLRKVLRRTGPTALGGWDAAMR